MRDRNAPEALRSYRLPDGVLRQAPRQPFVSFSRDSLRRYLAKIELWPEMRGPMSSAARALGIFANVGKQAPWIVIEVHVDARGVPLEMSNRLIGLGFELDGFTKFVPAAFDSHFTLKFKADPADRFRVRQLLIAAKEQARCAARLFEDFPDAEGYIESEVYTSNSRLVWQNQALDQVEQGSFPLEAGQLRPTVVSRFLSHSDGAAIADTVTKKADIHVKLDKDGPLAGSARRLAARLVSAGFYEVETWSGNTVMTAQFESGATASRIFRRLASFFDQYGGAAEMSLEHCYEMWRSRDKVTDLLADVPPVCVGN